MTTWNESSLIELDRYAPLMEKASRKRKIWFAKSLGRVLYVWTTIKSTVLASTVLFYILSLLQVNLISTICCLHVVQVFIYLSFNTKIYWAVFASSKYLYNADISSFVVWSNDVSMLWDNKLQCLDDFIFVGTSLKQCQCLSTLSWLNSQSAFSTCFAEISLEILWWIYIEIEVLKTSIWVDFYPRSNSTRPFI